MHPALPRGGAVTLSALALLASIVAPSLAAAPPSLRLPANSAVEAAGGRLVVVTRLADGRHAFRQVTAARGQGRATAARLATGAGVTAVLPDGDVQAYGWPADGAPDDPYYATSQGDLPQIGVPGAWPSTTGSNAIVAVLDTGANLAHPDLAAVNVVGTYNALDGTANIADGHGHGTHVLGTIAAATNNGIGVAGIAPSASVLVVKVLGDNGSGSWSAICSGIEWAAAHGATVISMSLGSSSPILDLNNPMQTAVNDAYAAGVTVVAAAGNSGNTDYSVPASLDHVVSVASVGASGAKSGFSQANDRVDIAAPGENTLSTSRTGSYVSMSGTSMATPHVAGVAALVHGAIGNVGPDAIESILERSATDAGAAGYDTGFGFGIVRADAAVALAREGAPGTPLPHPTPRPTPTPQPTPVPTPDLAKPTVTVKSPLGQASLANVVVTARFSEPIVASSATFAVTSAAPGLASKTISGSISYDPATWTLRFTPSEPLPSGPTYTAKVGGVKDVAGNLAANASWTFYAPKDTQAPVAISMTPYGTQGALGSVVVTVRYHERLGDNGSTAKFTLTSSAPGLATKTIPGTLAYDAGNTMYTFWPSIALPVGPTYKAAMSNVRDLTGNATSTTWTFSGPLDLTPPAPASISPTGFGLDLAAASAIRVRYSEPLGDNGATAKVALKSSAPGLATRTIAGTTVYDPATNGLTFTPSSALPTGPVYLVSVTGARDRSGNLSQPLTWSFSAPQDTVAPRIVASGPVGPGVDLAGLTSISATFSEPLGDNGTTAKVTVTGAAPGLPATTIAGTLAYDAGATTLRFTPRSPIPFGPTYTVLVTGVRDRSGNLASNSTWTFSGPVDTTAPWLKSSSPTGSGIAPSTQVVATFAEPLGVNGATATMLVYSGPLGGTATTPVAGSVAYRAADNSLVFTPKAGGLPGLTYRVVITGARDRSGNLAGQVSWTWDGPPADRTAPTLLSATPTGTSSPAKPTIAGTFSEPVSGAVVTVGVYPPGGARITVGGTLRMTSATTFTFVPSTSFLPGSTVEVRVSGARDPSGNVMTGAAWTFRT